MITKYISFIQLQNYTNPKNKSTVSITWSVPVIETSIKVLEWIEILQIIKYVHVGPINNLLINK